MHNGRAIFRLAAVWVVGVPTEQQIEIERGASTMGMILVALGAGVGLFVLVAAVLWQTYNRLVLLHCRCDNAFAQIEVQLKRRYDLIPNLVEAVKGYLSHESETLESVIAARNQAASDLAKAAQNPADAAAVKSFIGTESTLSSALSRLNFVMESYPELKANQNVADLMEELAHTENRLAFTRQAFNDQVTLFNSYRQSLPTLLFAGQFGYSRDRDLLEFADSTQIQSVPEVSLVG